MDNLDKIVDLPEVVVTPELLRNLARSKVIFLEMQYLVEHYEKELKDLCEIVYKS